MEILSIISFFEIFKSIISILSVIPLLFVEESDNNILSLFLFDFSSLFLLSSDLSSFIDEESDKRVI